MAFRGQARWHRRFNCASPLGKGKGLNRAQLGNPLLIHSKMMVSGGDNVKRQGRGGQVAKQGVTSNVVNQG
eukprot:3898340-Pyramimonas_sp.AAC.1